MEKQNQKVRELFEKHKLSAFLILLLVSFIIVVGFYHFYEKEISILDNQKKILIKTRKNTVSEVLKEQNITLRHKDQIKPSLDTKIKEDMKIKIQRAKPVTIIADGKKQEILTAATKVETILKEAKIQLGKRDKVEPKGTSKIGKDRRIQIVRVTQKNMIEEQPIQYCTQKQLTEQLDIGNTKIVRQGENGLKKRQMKVTYEDGKEVKRELIREKIVIEPRDEVIQVGINDTINTSRGNSRFQKAIVVTATAYCPTDPGVDGVTSVGARLQRGVIAVDPSVIPYHTKIYVPGYGFGEALDTGGAIRGSRIDLAMSSKQEALQYGRRQVKIYLLED